MQLLEEQGRSATPVGRIALSVLLFQDLMVAPVLFGVGILARDGEYVALSLAGALLQAAVAGPRRSLRPAATCCNRCSASRRKPAAAT